MLLSVMVRRSGRLTLWQNVLIKESCPNDKGGFPLFSLQPYLQSYHEEDVDHPPLEGLAIF